MRPLNQRLFSHATVSCCKVGPTSASCSARRPLRPSEIARNACEAVMASIKVHNRL